MHHCLHRSGSKLKSLRIPAEVGLLDLNRIKKQGLPSLSFQRLPPYFIQITHEPGIPLAHKPKASLLELEHLHQMIRQASESNSHVCR